MTQTDESITLEWRNSRASVTGYRVKYGPISGGAHGEVMSQSGQQDKTQTTITGEDGVLISASRGRPHQASKEEARTLDCIFIGSKPRGDIAIAPLTEVLRSLRVFTQLYANWAFLCMIPRQPRWAAHFLTVKGYKHLHSTSSKGVEWFK